MARAPAIQETEALPEADCLEGFPHPRFTAVLYGQEAAESALAEAFASGRVHHGWLLTGPEGVGKATLAYRFAAHALAEPQERDPFGQSLGVDAETTAARQVKALSHPGLLLLRRPWDFKAKRLATAITVDEVRRLRSFLSHQAEEGQWRIVLVDQADDLNVNAANALLKSLEEPPTRTIFLLLSSQPGRLLPTIRSRCRTLELQPLGLEALRKAATQALTQSEKDHPEPAKWPLIERLAKGSVRHALSLSTGGGLALFERVEKHVGALPRVDWAGVHAMADELSGLANEQRFELFYELLQDLLARVVRAAATAEGAAEDVRHAARMVAPGRLTAWTDLWEAIGADKAQAMALNLDRKALILDTFARLEAATRR